LARSAPLRLPAVIEVVRASLSANFPAEMVVAALNGAAKLGLRTAARLAIGPSDPGL